MILKNQDAGLALWIFYAQNHNGMMSEFYRRLSRISSTYRPPRWLSETEFFAEGRNNHRYQNARVFYSRLCNSHDIDDPFEPKPDAFVRAYIRCALWATNHPDTEEPLDDTFEPDDISSDSMRDIVADCTTFERRWASDIADDVSQAGHDFWLTRCGHGCGFGDGDWPELFASRVSDDCRRFGNVDIYPGDDGFLHFEGNHDER